MGLLGTGSGGRRRRLRGTTGSRSVRALPCSYSPLRVLGLKGPRRPPGWLWSRKGILPEAGQPWRLPGTLASPAEVDFVVLKSMVFSVSLSRWPSVARNYSFGPRCVRLAIRR